MWQVFPDHITILWANPVSPFRERLGSTQWYVIMKYSLRQLNFYIRIIHKFIAASCKIIFWHIEGWQTDVLTSKSVYWGNWVQVLHRTIKKRNFELVLCFICSRGGFWVKCLWSQKYLGGKWIFWYQNPKMAKNWVTSFCLSTLDIKWISQGGKSLVIVTHS